MKSKKSLTVELKDPQLRRIRNNLRDIIKLAVKEELSRLDGKEHRYFQHYLESSDPVAKEEWERKYHKFRRREERLRKMLSRSILKCDFGAHPDTDLDMVWMPSFGAWYCTKCAEILSHADEVLGDHPDYLRNKNIKF